MQKNNKYQVSPENMDEGLDTDMSVQETINVTNLASKSIHHEASGDLSKHKNYRRMIADGLSYNFYRIWGNIYMAKEAINGNPLVYGALLYDKFDSIVCESASSEVKNVVSIAFKEVKQPTLQSVGTNRFQEESIDKLNTFISEVVFENILTIQSCFKDALEGGISFLHIDTRYSNSPSKTATLRHISPLKTIWDVDAPATKIYDSSLFLMEEYMNADAIRTMLGSSEELDSALNKQSGLMEIDTFPLEDFRRNLYNRNIEVGTKFRVHNSSEFKTQMKDEVTLGSSKVTTVYVKTKAPTKTKGFKNKVRRFIFVNNEIVASTTLGTQYIPIVSFVMDEDMSSHSECKYKSVYHLIKNNLIEIATISSSMNQLVQNSINAPIFFAKGAITDGTVDEYAMRNRLVPVNTSKGPLQECISSPASQGIPPGYIEMLALSRNSIKEKLNLISVSDGAQSAQQEQIRLDNQIELSSYAVDILDNSILQLGHILKSMVPIFANDGFDFINSLLPEEKKIKDEAEAISIIEFSKESRVVLEQSNFLSDKGSRDLSRVTKVNNKMEEKAPLPASVMMKLGGVSGFIVEEVEKAEELKSANEQAVLELQKQKADAEVRHKIEETEKLKAETEKLKAEALKLLSESKSIQAEDIKKAESTKAEAKNKKTTPK